MLWHGRIHSGLQLNRYRNWNFWVYWHGDERIIHARLFVQLLIRLVIQLLVRLLVRLLAWLLIRIMNRLILFLETATDQISESRMIAARQIIIGCCCRG